VASFTRGLEKLRKVTASLGIDKGLQGPHGESGGRGPKPYSLAQLLNFTKLSLSLVSVSLCPKRFFPITSFDGCS